MPLCFMNLPLPFKGCSHGCKYPPSHISFKTYLAFAFKISFFLLLRQMKTPYREVTTPHMLGYDLSLTLHILIYSTLEVLKESLQSESPNQVVSSKPSLFFEYRPCCKRTEGSLEEIKPVVPQELKLQCLLHVCVFVKAVLCILSQSLNHFVPHLLSIERLDFPQRFELLVPHLGKLIYFLQGPLLICPLHVFYSKLFKISHLFLQGYVDP